MKHIFVVNPSSRGNTLKKIRDIKAVCDVLNINWTIKVSDSKDDTKRIIDEYRDKYCVIYAVGGDGTINTIVNGLIGGKAFLGIVPNGADNDFYRSVDEKQGPIIECNVMKVNDLYCINIFSVGIDAEIYKNVHRMQSLHFPKSLVYPLSMAYTFYKHQNEPMLVNVDGFKYYDYMTLVAICNGKYYGRGVKFDPYADIADGDAAVCMVGNLNRKELPELLSSVNDGTLFNNSQLEVLLGDKITIDADSPIIGNVDGEVVESSHFDIDTSATTITIFNNKDLLELMRKRNKKL